jgi:hypothetical protein
MFESLIRSVKTADKEFDVSSSILAPPPPPPSFSTCVTRRACSKVSKFVRNLHSPESIHGVGIVEIYLRGS